jgi:uncharacterized membrane protein YqjE
MSANPHPGGAERTLGEIVRGLTEDISVLVRSEIAMAKLELKQAVGKLSGGLAMFGVALFCALFGLAFLLVTGILALALIMPAWLAALLVAVMLFVAAGVLAVLGKKKFSSLNFVPSETISQVRQDIDTIKADIARARSH